MNHTLKLNDYWEKLVDYYYDNILWDENEGRYKPFHSINDWLGKEYDAMAVKELNKIIFNDEEKLSWFILRWS